MTVYLPFFTFLFIFINLSTCPFLFVFFLCLIFIHTYLPIRLFLMCDVLLYVPLSSFLINDCLLWFFFFFQSTSLLDLFISCLRGLPRFVQGMRSIVCLSRRETCRWCDSSAGYCSLNLPLMVAGTSTFLVHLEGVLFTASSRGLVQDSVILFATNLVGWYHFSP